MTHIACQLVYKELKMLILKNIVFFNNTNDNPDTNID